MRGRPREFDKSQALESAMLVFWRKGYRGTSLDDLTEAMQINRPSLYSAFGDKEQLFLESIDHYKDIFVAPAVKKFMSCQSLHQGLPEFFSAFARIITESESPPGCFIACLLSEEACESQVISDKLSELIAGADAAFTQVLTKHQDELRSGMQPQAAAKLLTSVMHGMSIRARTGAKKSTLVEIGRTFIESILEAD